MDTTFEERLVELVKSFVEDPRRPISLGDRFEEDLDMDSLVQVEFCLEVEEEFGVTVPDEILEGFHALQDYVDYIRPRLHSPGEDIPVGESLGESGGVVVDYLKLFSELINAFSANHLHEQEGLCAGGKIYNHPMGGISYLKDFRTVGLITPRKTGKTDFAIERLHVDTHSCMVFPSFGQRAASLERVRSADVRQRMFTIKELDLLISQRPDIIGALARADIVFIDNAMPGSQRERLEESLYGVLARYCRPDVTLFLV